MAPQSVNALTAYFERVYYDDLDKIMPSTGFLSRFGRPETGAITVRVNDALEFSMDIVRNKKRISKIYPRSQAEAMTNLGASQKTTTGQLFENVARDFPIMRENANVSYDDTFKRLPGELAVRATDSGGSMAFTKAAINLARDVKENMMMMIGKLEAIAFESLSTGIITLNDGTTYNFGRASTNTDTVGTTWNNVATATPFADLSTHYTIVRRNGKGNPQAVVMAGDAFNAFLNTTEVLNSADNRDISFVRASDQSLNMKPLPPWVTEMESQGFSYMAYYKDLRTGRKMYIFVYDQDYQDQDSSDAWANYMTAKKVLFFDPMMRLDRFFGPRVRFDYQTPEEMMINRLFRINRIKASLPAQLGNGVVESWMWHHDTISNGDKTSVGIESYMCPLLACTEVDSAGLLTVLP